jgi:hypothetical protein
MGAPLVMRAGFFYSVLVRFRSFSARFWPFSVRFSAISVRSFGHHSSPKIVQGESKTPSLLERFAEPQPILCKEAFVNAFGLSRLALGICLTARATQLCVRQHVAVVAEGAEVVCIKHEPLLLSRGRTLFDGAHVMHLSSSRRAALSLTTLAQRVSREHHAP